MNSSDDRYYCHNRRKYMLKVYLVLVTKYRRKFLLDYDTTECVCGIVKSIKQMTTYKVWQKYSSVLCKTYYKKQVFWSDGYFACSIGEVSVSTIHHYIENQG